AMDTLVMIIAYFLTGFLGGFIGSMTGLGGASIATPILSTILGVPLRLSIATSFATITANSIAGSIRYILEGLTSIRLGILIALPALLGVVVGVYTNISLDIRIIYILYGLTTISLIILGHLKTWFGRVFRIEGISIKRLDLFIVRGDYIDRSENRNIHFEAHNYIPAIPLMMLSGFIGGLFGIGGGVVNVITMEMVMGVPIKVAVATSTYVIGYISSVGSILYWKKGFLSMVIASLMIPGMILGSTLGSSLMPRMRSQYVRILFEAVALFLAFRMLLEGLSH
ncbi:MAG: sulfite exporter TauE/SafE family protein, partial [Sulfolobales archaeon]